MGGWISGNDGRGVAIFYFIWEGMKRSARSTEMGWQNKEMGTRFTEMSWQNKEMGWQIAFLRNYSGCPHPHLGGSPEPNATTVIPACAGIQPRVCYSQMDSRFHGNDVSSYLFAFWLKTTIHLALNHEDVVGENLAGRSRLSHRYIKQSTHSQS